MPRLTVRGPGGGQPVTYRMDRETITVGRASGADLVIDDPTLSRLHAELRRTASGWVVLDRGSRNGTRLNDQPVTRTTPLKDGDRIELGDTQIEFHARVEAAARGAGEDPPTRTIHLEAEDDAILGCSQSMVELLEACDRVAATPATVLITGESGTGKELIARRLHRRSGRPGAFVVVNCPALPGALLEAELFGIERGVATGVEARIGLFESAAGGTLLLDEIGDMELAAQAKLLRVLQEGQVTRIGARRPIEIDVRVLAATHHDLEVDVAAGRFRRDLYHRLAVVHLRVPPLRDRPGDVALLAAFALSKGGDARSLSLAPETLELMSRYSFPGNVRELLHAIERARLFTRDGVVRPQDLPEAMRGAAVAPESRESIGEADPTLLLYERIRSGEVSFWEGVAGPFLARSLSREDARRLIAHAYGSAGGSYKRLAEGFALTGREYKRLLDFLRHHDLRPSISTDDASPSRSAGGRSSTQ